MTDLNDSPQQRQCSALNDTTARNTVKIVLEPTTPRQLGDEGLLVIWRDGADPGKREGLACILSMCPHPDCGCRDVYIDGYVVDESATAVRWNDEGVQQKLPTGSAATWTALDEKLFAIVDPDSGDTRAHPDLVDETDPEFLDWLVFEMDGELLEVLHRFRARARGYPVWSIYSKATIPREFIHLPLFLLKYLIGATHAAFRRLNLNNPPSLSWHSTSPSSLS